MLKFTHFCNLKEFSERSGFIKFAALAFEARDFLNWGFGDSFSYKTFSYKKNLYTQEYYF